MCNGSLFAACLLMVVVVANAQTCAWNEEEVECVNPCNTCAQRASCITECTPGCDCKEGFFRNWYGFCIPERFCGPPEDIEVDVEDDGGCPRVNLCRRSCRRRGLPGGRCVGRRRRTCRCG